MIYKLLFSTLLICFAFLAHNLRGALHESTRWITSNKMSERSPLIRHEFKVNNELKRATAKVSAVGYMEFYLNGKHVSADVLFPDPTQYQKRILFRKYDVTKQLLTGMNAIGFWLNEGQAASTLSNKKRFYNRKREFPGVFAAPAAWLELTLEYNDGTIDVVRTDKQWKTASSPLTYAHFYGGEDYDARLEREGWSSSGFNASAWNHVVEDRSIDVELSPSVIPPARVVDVITPIAHRIPKAGIYLYDLGQNIGGWWRVRVKGKAGSVITIRGSETVDNRHSEDGFENAKRVSDKPNHSGRYYARDAKSVYTLKGGEEEVYEPRFFYSGFRYIEVICSDPSAIDRIDVQGCCVHNNVEWIGDFKCSDERLNRLHLNTAWSIKGILQGAPMSNPNSEKYGWTGDVHLFSEAADAIFDMEGVWRKWLQDLRDAQEVVGKGVFLPSTVPNFRTEYTSTSSVWGATYPLTAWYLYRHTGDETIYAEYYEPICKWADHLWSEAKDNLVSGIWADHASPTLNKNGRMGSLYMAKKQREVLGTAYYILTENILSEMALVLDKRKEAEQHRDRSAKAQESLNAKYFDAAKSLYIVEANRVGHDPLQTVNLVPIQMGIEPVGAHDSILKNVYSNIRETHDNHLMTGIVGTKALVKVLVREGKGDLLYDVVTNSSYPGWGYWLEQGATTHWQYWSGISSDHNHAMMGSVEEFFMHGIAGIIPPTERGTEPGWKRVRITPLILEKLSWAEGKVPTPHGVISSRWEKNNSGVLITITLPDSVSGVLELSDSLKGELKAGVNSFLLDSGMLIPK